MTTEIIDPKTTPQATHPWVYAIVFAEGDLALVAEVENVQPVEITRFAIAHAKEITDLMYEAFKGKLIKEMQGRLGEMSDGNLLKLFDLVKGNPNFSQVVVEGAGAEGGLPKFTINMGVHRASDD